jgi:RecB family exonuclease
MTVKVVWTFRDCVQAVAALPVQGPLPCRIVLVRRERIAHSLRRDLIRNGFGNVLAGTRFVPLSAAAAEVIRNAGTKFRSGEEDLRAARLSGLFRSQMQLRHFSRDLLCSKPGWEEAFARTISDLEGAGLRPEELDVSGQSARLQDVAAIWRAVDQSAGRSWTVQRTYVEAANALDVGPEAWPFQGTALAFVGGEITTAEARFFRAVPELTIGLLAARPARERYLNRMEALLGKHAGDVLRSAAGPRVAETERDLVASYLFEPPIVLADPDRPRSTGPDGTVEIEEHSGVDAEIEATADWVARQIAGGIALEEVAVLVPALDPLSGFVANRLARVPWHDGSLPVHIAGGLPLADFSAGARALAVVRALRGHLAAGSLADVLPALRSSAADGRRLSRGAAMDLAWSLGTVGGNPARREGALDWADRVADREADLSEQLARAQTIENESPEAGLARRAIDIERLLADLQAIRPALGALVGLARLAVEGANLTTLWPRLFNFFDEWLLQPGDGPGVHVILNERLDRMASDEQCGTLAGEDALRIVEEVMTSARVPVGHFGDPSVYLGTVREAIGLRFRAVRIIGLAEGHLPSMPPEDPVIPDALRESVRFPQTETEALLPTAIDRSLNDLHALDLVVRDVGSHIALSAARLGVDRSEREPSSVILEAAAALGRPNRSTGEAGATIPDAVALRRDSFVPARQAAANFRRETPLGEAAWQDCVSQKVIGVPPHWHGVETLDLGRLRDLTAVGPAGPLDGIFGTASAQIQVHGLTSDLPISPSTLETLLRCPHAFLLGNLLGFEEPVAPPTQREIGPPAYGQLLHAVASEFYNRNGSSFCIRERTLADWVSLAEEIADRSFQTFLNEYPLVGEAVRVQQRERLRRDICELIAYDWETSHGRRFVFAERAFGRPFPVELPLGEHSLFVRGRIDRIDVEGLTTLVRDLKTGRAHPRIGKAKDPDPRLDVQIAIYGLVAQTLADEWKIPKRVAVAYAYIGRSGAVERVYEEDFHTVLEPAARHWLAIAAGLLAGQQFPRTPSADDCIYCCFRPVCGETGYSRAAALLAGAEGVLADFGALKGLDPRQGGLSNATDS